MKIGPDGEGETHEVTAEVSHGGGWWRLGLVATVAVLGAWLVVGGPAPDATDGSAETGGSAATTPADSSDADPEGSDASDTETREPTTGEYAPPPVTRSEGQPPPVGELLPRLSRDDPDYGRDLERIAGDGPPMGEPLPGRLLVAEPYLATIVDLTTGDRVSFHPPGRPVAASSRWIVWQQADSGAAALSPVDAPTSTAQLATDDQYLVSLQPDPSGDPDRFLGLLVSENQTEYPAAMTELDAADLSVEPSSLYRPFDIAGVRSTGDGRIAELSTDGQWEWVAEGYSVVAVLADRVLARRCPAGPTACETVWLSRSDWSVESDRPAPPESDYVEPIVGTSRALVASGPSGASVWDVDAGRFVNVGHGRFDSGSLAVIDDRYLVVSQAGQVVTYDLDQPDPSGEALLSANSEAVMVFLPDEEADDG